MARSKIDNEIIRKLDLLLEAQGIDPAEAMGEAGPEVARAPSLDPTDVAARINYDAQSAAEIIERVDSLTEAERLALADYESARGNRSTVLKALKGD